MKRWLSWALLPLMIAGCITIHTAKPLVRDDLAEAGIITMYDDFHDLHAVQMRHVKVPSNYTEGDLLLQAYSREKGLRIRRPEKLFLMITAGGFRPERLDDIKEMTLISDGKSLNLPVVHEGLGTISGICVMTVTLAQFQAFAAAKQASGKLGPYTFTLNDPARSRMRALIEALTTPQPEPAK